ncbi:MAG: AmmeMemoRadiSam system radical SAM enzyme [Myxococcales bacterium]
MGTRHFMTPHVVRGEFWHTLEGGKVQCDLCPRHCRLSEGQRGFCFVREARDGGVVLTSYGKASGFCIDPIEKKPLNHFLPGTSVLSFGTAGCNLGCRFCQNWDISKAREQDRLTDSASPESIARHAKAADCRSIAFTYNDPTIFAEYAIDCAEAAREQGVRTVAVTAGYIGDKAREAFYRPMDAANVDLKAFTEGFYKKLCFAELQPVLDTLVWLKQETRVWFEVTTLLIPEHNDSEAEVERLCSWFLENLGAETPLHFTAFHPDFKLTSVPPTPASTLTRARNQALAIGLKHVYTGNVHDVDGQSTYCAACGERLIQRDWYLLSNYELTGAGACRFCGHQLAGHFAAKPGSWGPRRVRLPIHERV